MEKLKIRGTVPDLSRAARIYKIAPEGVASVRRIVNEVLTRPEFSHPHPESESEPIERETATEAGQ